MTQLEGYVSAKDYAGLVSECEALELSGATCIEQLQEVYALWLAGYVAINDLDSARFLRKRMIKANVTDVAEANVVWSVCVTLWEQNYAEFYKAAHNDAWSPSLQVVINDIEEMTRERMINTVAKAYTCIPMSDAENYIGLRDMELIQGNATMRYERYDILWYKRLTREMVDLIALVGRGWSYDPATQRFVPQKEVVAIRDPSNISHLSTLSDMVMHLENF
ncbi:COP9 signalosome [Radiomyces spectabilis]|uniref:COP9 signalosome n=1 Tax=Radiomyces spectabilis TaxID=64574 RepID=UPI00221F60DF|nr:COP9 signalosome [Radiomyces spectabilis]KAI8377848.1 COP9 signalosome [Radiomyces spectabilis]